MLPFLVVGGCIIIILLLLMVLIKPTGVVLFPYALYCYNTVVL